MKKLDIDNMMSILIVVTLISLSATLLIFTYTNINIFASLFLTIPIIFGLYVLYLEFIKGD